MGDTYEECLLLVTGETVSLNTFDKIFRSGYGPQWSDRPRSHTAHYSFHALFPVPEAVQRRGFDAAGRLWSTGCRMEYQFFCCTACHISRYLGN